MATLVRNVSTAKVDLVFLNSYQEFLETQRKHSIHPIDDSIENIQKVVSLFVSLFQKAPESEKEMLATSPLFPEDVKFERESRESTRPLNYVIFLANKKALKMISEYLKPTDWSRLGPFRSTLMHCLIAGLDKGSVCLIEAEPISCAKAILKNYPESRTTCNVLGQSPLDHLEIVQRKLQHNYEHILKYGREMGGDIYLTLSNCTTERGSDYTSAIYYAEELKKTLNNQVSRFNTARAPILHRQRFS